MVVHLVGKDFIAIRRIIDSAIRLSQPASGFGDRADSRFIRGSTACNKRFHAGAFVLQQPFTHRPALVQLADEIFFLCDRIIEKGFVEGRFAADQTNGLNRHPRLIHG